MLKEVLLGKIGLTMETGILVNWFKKEGDYVEKGEPLFEIETDKATQVIESFHSGYLKKILVQKGEEVPVKTVIAYIGEKDDSVPDIGEARVNKTTQPVSSAQERIREDKESVKTGGRRSSGRINASPLAKRLAAELGVDISKVHGTGPDGRIGKDDVLAAKNAYESQKDSGTGIEKESAPYADRTLKVASELRLRGIRKVVADRMKTSYTQAPHIHLELYADMTQVMRFRDSMNNGPDATVHITYTDILTSFTAKMLRKHMLLNSTLEGDTVKIFDEINIGIAVATGQGLVVPVIRNADVLSLSELASMRLELVERTKAGKQRPSDLANGTFTITNLGMFGIVSFKPIINTGQAAILAVGKIIETPVADESGSISLKPLMNLSLACDHRIADGADGAKFLSDLKNLIETADNM